MGHSSFFFACLLELMGASVFPEEAVRSPGVCLELCFQVILHLEGTGFPQLMSSKMTGGDGDRETEAAPPRQPTMPLSPHWPPFQHPQRFHLLPKDQVLSTLHMLGLPIQPTTDGKYTLWEPSHSTLYYA